MSKYHTSDELYRYGVLGMKWGVRRASKKLSKATTSEQRDKAINSLNKHRAKSVKKVSKLDTRITKLQKKADKDASVNSARAAKLDYKAARLNKKANSIIRIRALDGFRNWRSARLSKTSKRMQNSIERTKSQLYNSQKTRELFNQGINNIDEILVDKGKNILAS